MMGKTQILDLDHPGQQLHDLAVELFPICRSITGDGVRATLDILSRYVPLSIHEVPSGTEVLDWKVPLEWSIREAYIIAPDGQRIVDFAHNNLHVVGYSRPVDAIMPLDELQSHLHSLPDMPQAIPYVTSYYVEDWGFCLSHEVRARLPSGDYRVVIDSSLEDGSLTYGELVIPGATSEEVFLSTYVCHPSMANNELSGPLVATALAQWLASEPRRYTYRLVFVPETIGSITYLSRHLRTLRSAVRAGFNLTCIGDDRSYSYVPSRAGNTLADRASLCVLENDYPDFLRYTFLDRGSDERQYCSPGVDLPMVSVMRSKYREYPEYHTSLDDLSLVTPSGLDGGFRVVRDCIELIERNRTFVATRLGEPQLGKYGLYPSLGTRDTHTSVAAMLNILAYADGQQDLIDILRTVQVSPQIAYQVIDVLSGAGLIEEVAVGTHGTRVAES